MLLQFWPNWNVLKEMKPSSNSPNLICRVYFFLSCRSCVDADGLAEEDSFPGKLLNVILYSNDVLEREALINLP